LLSQTGIRRGFSYDLDKSTRARRPTVPSLKFGIIEQKVFFRASPDDVYDALLDPKKHADLTGSPATTSDKKGAKFTAWDGYVSGKNLELVKGRR
jgi:hypothetical protein